MQISRGIIKGPQKVVIYGPEGIGKSSLAAQFPIAVFIDTEGSTKHMDVARTPYPSSWTMLMDQVNYFKTHPTECNTLIIDTADWAEQLCITDICSRYNKDGIEEFGYGKGYVYLVEEFGRLLNALNELIEVGINVVMTAHGQMRKFEQPDEMGAYDRWEMKLQKKTAPLVKEWADMVLFTNYKTFVVATGDNGKGSKKAQGGQRVIYTQHHPCWDAKNRHGLPDELTFKTPEDGWRQIAHCIPVRSTKTVSQPEQSNVPDPVPDAVDLDSLPSNGPHIEKFVPDSLQLETPVKEQPSETAKSEPPTESLDGIPKALADLMKEFKVTPSEIQQVCAQRGYYPIDTPISNYDSAFIDGGLVALWPQVYEFIQKNRK